MDCGDLTASAANSPISNPSRRPRGGRNRGDSFKALPQVACDVARVRIPWRHGLPVQCSRQTTVADITRFQGFEFRAAIGSRAGGQRTKSAARIGH